MGTHSSFASPDGISPALQVEKIHENYSLHPAGYIFMCNQRTKPQCYRYRVFGLPRSKKEVVERIKPGAKLFLFDFESKYLYGVYEATAEGNTDLEPGAFDGKFPAQVRFRIFKECIPLPEKSFKSAIHDNYTGSKFKQELDLKQVESLISLFSPLAASSSTSVPLLSANAASAQQNLPSRMDKYPSRIVSSGDPCATATEQAHIRKKLLSSLYPYLYPMQLSHAPQVMQPLPMQEAETLQRLELTTSTPVEHSLQATEHGRHPVSTGSYHYAESQQAYFSGRQDQIMQLSHAPQVMHPLPMQEAQTLQHLVHTTSTPVEYSPQAIEHGGHLGSTGLYHYAESQQAYFGGRQDQIIQEPYLWYGPSQQMVHGNQPVGVEIGHQPMLVQKGGETAQHQGTVAGYHHELPWPRNWENSQPYYCYSMPTTGYGSSNVQLQAPASGWPRLNVPTSSYYPFQES